MSSVGLVTKCRNLKDMEMLFSPPVIKLDDRFSVHISLIYEHLFYKYFVLWSVRALLLMDVIILVDLVIKI